MIQFDSSEFSLPTVDSYEQFLKRVRHSAPGPDGVPYAAWYKTGQTGWKTLQLVGEHMMFTAGPLEGFNDSYIAMPPKGSLPEDREAVIRPPEDTRPLNLKNTDNKAITAVTSEPLANAIPRWSGIAMKRTRGRVNFGQIKTQ